MEKVCIIGVYFGVLPNYFDIWLRSAASNKTIDFMIFTDIDEIDLPPNVKFIPMTYDQINRRILEKTGVCANIDRPYKFCDLKPMYGLLFEDYITQYDYWGHCDFDLIWGDIRSFLVQYNLSQYDKFLPLGHLSLYRNTKENNRRFMLSASSCAMNYKQVLTNAGNFAFDELAGVFKIYEEYGYSHFKGRIFGDISKIYKRYRLVKYDTNYDHQVFYWENGKVFRKFLKNGCLETEEFIYIHFKERGRLPFEKEVLDAKRFFITPQGFFASEKQEVTLADIQAYNPFKNAMVEKLEYGAFLLREFWKKADYKMRTVLKMKKRLR